MPVQHSIDTSKKLITTAWTGEATDSELIAALAKYQCEIRCLKPYIHYDEILDFTETSSFNLTTTGLRTLSQMASRTDTPGTKTRLAIVVTRTVAYGLARMYQTFRALLPDAHKDVQVFRNDFEARKWLESERE